MATKFGTVAERLVGAAVFFIPDGSNIGTVMAPELTDALTKPAELSIWEDYNIGTVNQSAYDPVKESRSLDGFRYGRRKYVRETKEVILNDAFNITLIEYPATLFDRLMYGLEADPVADTAQPIFSLNVRERRGWVKILRFTEDKVLLCDAEFRVKVTIQENPPDSFAVGSPVLRIETLGDTDPELESVTFNPAED